MCGAGVASRLAVTRDLMEKRESTERPDAQRPARKKPYFKPAFRFERTFETMALACGKMAGNEGQCHMVLKRS